MNIDDKIAIIAASGQFDEAHYRIQTGTDGSETELMRHYIVEGERRGFWPTKEFDPYLYLIINRDVARAGESPFIHYILHGAAEGRAIDVKKPLVPTQTIIDMFSEITNKINKLEAANQRVENTLNQKGSTVATKARDAAQRLARIGRRVSNPKAGMDYLRALYFESEHTSYRAKNGKKGWKSKLDQQLLLKTVITRAIRELFHKQVVYEFKNKQKAVDYPHRIMHFIPNVFLGGSTQLVLDIFNALSHEYEMHIATSAFPKEGRLKGVTIHDLREPVSTETIVNLLKSFQADLIHVHYWGDVDDAWYGKVFSAASELRIPTIQNVNTPVAPFRSRSIVANVFVSEYVMKEFKHPNDATRSLVIYPGIDLTSFLPSEIHSEEVFNSIGMVYRLETDKLNMKSIELFIAVVKKRPRTRVFIIGGGSLYEPFVKEVCKAGLRNNFVFTGYVDYKSLPGYYKQFSIFIAPTWKESFGQVAPFAMSAGRAVAGFDVGAISEIIGDPSLLGMKVEDASEIIVKLLEDRERLTRIGQFNSERARSMFDVKQMTASYHMLYKELTGSSANNALPLLEFEAEAKAT